MATQVTTSFVDSTTLQLRFELGDIVKGAVTTDIPTNVNFNASDGYGFSQADSQLVGRLVGPNNEYFMPVDGFTSSDIADLFAWTETNAVRSARVDTLADWSVSVDGTAVNVTGISRKANILETATTGWQREFSTVHNVFLELSAPLSEGAEIEIHFDDVDFNTTRATYSPDTTISEAIHVNLAGYDPDAGVKMAYLSSWNGFEYDATAERGGAGVPQAFTEGMSFDVWDEATGSIVLSGATELTQGEDDGTNFWQNYASAPVFEMDLSALDDAGQYYLTVEGVGRSQSFALDDGHWQDLFGLTFKGYYHQRSGVALTEEFTDWTRPSGLNPNEGIVVQQTTVKITETSEAWDGSLPKPFEFWNGRLTGETLDDAWGGWHDAGDFDRRTQHMETSRKLIELHELHGRWSEDVDANIPESDNGIPDLIDEAIWGSMVFRRLQHDDGGVPGGIESASYGSFGSASFTDGRDLYAYAPDAWSSWEYAATAAKIARALELYDPSEAAAWLSSARAAFDWAEDNTPVGEEYDNGFYARARNIAAAELFETTGEDAFQTLFEETFVYAGEGAIEWFAQQYEAAFLYARSTQSGVLSDLQDVALAALEERGQWLLDNGLNSGFGFVADPYAPYGWGNTASQPTYSSEILLRLHALTGDDTYLRVAEQDVDYAFGANPMNMSFVTGLDGLVPGVRQPLEILHGDAEVLGLAPPPGITLYGEYNIYDYGWQGYHSEMWLDTWPNYYDMPVHESWNGNYGYVPVTEFTVMQGMEDMTFVTGYLAALSDDRPTGRSVTVTDDDNAFPWSAYTDTFDANDVRVRREMIYDDGRLLDKTFVGGVQATATWLDPLDVKDWTRYEDTFDATGALASRSFTFDGGRVKETTFADGVRVGEVVTDPTDVFEWTSVSRAYSVTGQIESAVTFYDDGRTQEVDYVNGTIARSTTLDVDDAYLWDSQVLDYDAAGARFSRTTVYDDGTSETVFF